MTILPDARKTKSTALLSIRDKVIFREVMRDECWCEATAHLMMNLDFCFLVLPSRDARSNDRLFKKPSLFNDLAAKSSNNSRKENEVWRETKL